MTALFANGAMSGYLTHYDPAPGGEEHGLRIEPVLVLGFDKDDDPICVGADGAVSPRTDYSQLYLDWRWIPDPLVHGESQTGSWKSVAELNAMVDEEDADTTEGGALSTAGHP